MARELPVPRLPCRDAYGSRLRLVPALLFMFSIMSGTALTELFGKLQYIADDVKP